MCLIDYNNVSELIKDYIWLIIRMYLIDYSNVSELIKEYIWRLFSPVAAVAGRSEAGRVAAWFEESKPDKNILYIYTFVSLYICIFALYVFVFSEAGWAAEWFEESKPGKNILCWCLWRFIYYMLWLKVRGPNRSFNLIWYD